MKIRKTKNFVDLKIDYLIKLGGSLIANIDKAQNLAETLIALSENNRIVIFPGGGPIDNLIENIDKQFTLNEITHHQACARAQDQTGLIFANFNLNFFETTDNFADVRDILKRKKIPVLLPSKLIFMLDPFEKSWNISSDSMGAYFSFLLEANKFLILTDVDGIYTKNPTKDKDAKLIPKLTVNQLDDLGQTSVDETLCDFLFNASMSCWVLNGHNYDNLIDFFNQKDSVVCTEIS
jgi:5-(aminomethyl)-3-furanmethanol phosphate kinase